MKLKTTFLAALLTVFSIAAFAGEPSKGVPTIKLLPSKVPNVLKILYVNDRSDQVKVKLYNKKGLVKKDIIRPGNYNKGFVKNYDLSNLKTGRYWVEISVKGMSVKYEIQTTNNEPIWATHWKNYFPDEKVIASK